MTNLIFKEDCLDTAKRNLDYDYVICSPPDFEEIGYDPKDTEKYLSFLEERISILSPKSGFITILISDRKHDGTIIPKHTLMTAMLHKHGFNLVSQKIWVKSYKSNLYRLNYTFILTYHKSGYKKKNVTLPDVFYVEAKADGKYRDNFSIDVVKPIIESYTSENEIVFDPFIGCGTTALACIDLKRQYIGTEIVQEVYDLCMKNISTKTKGIFSLFGE